MTLEAIHEHITHDRCVLGLAARTSAATAAQDIPALWQDFMVGGWLEKLPRTLDDPAIYAVYTDYTSDEHGAYTLVLGVAVERKTKVSEGLRRVCIPAGEVAKFHVAGNPAEVVWRTWKHINGAWNTRGRRRYVADFERYPLQDLQPDSAVIDIAVGLSPE